MDNKLNGLKGQWESNYGITKIKRPTNINTIQFKFLYI
jgi:hypothetical protein